MHPFSYSSIISIESVETKEKNGFLRFSRI